MDPVSIASVVAQATGTCLTIIKKLYDLREKYKDAPVVIVAICSESTVLSASLAQIQGLLLQKHDAEVWRSRTELPAVLDQALTGVMVIFSLLEAEIQRITAGTSDPSRIRWRARLRMMWNESQLNDLLSSIRGQQTAMSLLIQLLQMNTLTEVRNMLREQGDTVRASASITQSLRAQNPSVRVANSIYDRTNQPRSHIPSADDAASIAAPSELEFEFDDMVINSQAYRRAMAHAQARKRPLDSRAEPPLGDVVDQTDNLTIRGEAIAPAAPPADVIDRTDDLIIRGEGRAPAAPPVPLQGLQDPTLHETPVRKQTADDRDPGGQHTDQVATAAEEADDTAVVAEPEEMATPVSQAMDHSRSSTPKELGHPGHVVRSGHGSEIENTCAKCGWRIFGKFVRVPTLAGNNRFHLDCFTCADCGKQITRKFFPLDDISLCERDYFRRLDLLCSSCDGALRGSYVTSGDRKFHPEHFRCEALDCHVVFGPYDSYYEHQSKHYCLYHYCQHYAQTCASCACPILQQFVEIQSGERAGLWHPDCHMIFKTWRVEMKPFASARLQRTDEGWRDRLGNPIGHAGLGRLLESVNRGIERIWSILCRFEQDASAQIEDILRGLSGSQDYTAFILTVRALLNSTATLLDAVQQVAEPSQYRREAKLLCLKIRDILPLALDTFLEKKGRPGPDTSLAQPDSLSPCITRDMLNLVTGIARYMQLVIGVGVRASTNLEVTAGADETRQLRQLNKFLQRFEDRKTPTALVRNLDAHLDGPRSPTSSFPANTDSCVGCGGVVEDCCYSSQTEAGVGFWHVECLPCEACGRTGAYEEGPDGPSRESEARTMECSFCRAKPPPGEYCWWSTVDIYIVLLYVALARFMKDVERGNPIWI